MISFLLWQNGSGSAPMEEEEIVSDNNEVNASSLEEIS